MLFFFLLAVSMATNVFEQTIDKEINIASNQIACTILEHLMPYADASILERFQTVFSAGLRPICSDQFASHILQKMIEVSFLRAVAKLQVEPVIETPVAKKRKVDEVEIPDEKKYNLTETFSQDHVQKCSEFVVKMSKFLLNNLEDFVWDRTACHLIRTCLMSLCGLFVYKTKDFIASTPHSVKRLTADKETPMIVPGEWAEIIQEYASRLQAWPQFVEFPYDELSSRLLQSLCITLKIIDKNELKHMGKKILNDCFLAATNEEMTDEKHTEDIKEEIKEENLDDDAKVTTLAKLPKVFSSDAAIRLLETILDSAGPKLMTQLNVKLFQGNLISLSNIKSSNFSVQKLLENVKQKEEFEAIFDELSPNIQNLLRIGHTGVVNALAQACLRLSAKQGAFVQSMQTALDCIAPKERADQLAILTMKLKPYEIATKDTTNAVHLHGSIILQAMLSFNKPIKLVQSLLDTKPNELAEIFSGPNGSYVVDAFIRSKYIGEKSREKFIKHLNGTFLEMAVSRHGSRAVEAMFEASGDNQRTRIVKELSEKMNQLNGSPAGRVICNILRVETYRMSPAQWKAAFNKEQKIEKLFKEII